MPGFHPNAIACVAYVRCVNENRKIFTQQTQAPANRNARSKQWQPWLAACQRKRLRFLRFSFTQRNNARNASDCVWMETGLQPASDKPGDRLPLLSASPAATFPLQPQGISPPFGQYQIILLGVTDRGTYVCTWKWKGRSWTSDLLIALIAYYYSAIFLSQACLIFF